MFGCCTSGHEVDSEAELYLDKNFSKRGFPLDVKDKLSLPWKKICAEDLKTWLPVKWNADSTTKDILTIQGAKLRDLLPTLSVVHKDNIAHVLQNDGSWYLGETSTGFKKHMHGFGHHYFPGVAYYVGTFSEGLRNGKGLLIYPDGSWFLGLFLRDQKEFGENYDVEDHTTFIGTFDNEVAQGVGIIKFKDGSKYQGEVKNGVQDGKGTFEWANGNKYSGEWKDGKKHGSGDLYIHAEEKCYCTYWIEGEMQ